MAFNIYINVMCYLMHVLIIPYSEIFILIPGSFGSGQIYILQMLTLQMWVICICLLGMMEGSFHFHSFCDTLSLSLSCNVMI